MFEENGPYKVSPDLSLHENPYSWHQHATMMYVDNPIGVGFSHTSSESRYVTNEDEVAADFHKFLVGFYQRYPEYLDVPLYIFGERYVSITSYIYVCV